MSAIKVTVPATTANLGPGFDCLGAALSLYNHFIFTALEPGQAVQIHAHGREAARVKLDQDNLVYQAFCKVFHQIGQPLPAVRIDIALDVPLARGLGSSATAIVGGLVGANALAKNPLSSDQVLKLAVAIEGHPDNVVPALLGGCQLAAAGMDTEWEVCDISWHSSIVPVVAVPDFELSTQEARQVMPAQYSRSDAIFNLAHLGLLLRGLETGEERWLKAALQDRIHQPYRKALIPGYDQVWNAAIAAGANGMVISGAGPTLLALANPTTAASVRLAIETAWTSLGIKTDARISSLTHQGAIAEVMLLESVDFVSIH